MLIDRKKCTDCEDCLCICPVEAIQLNQKRVFVHQDTCVECESCLRSGVCPTDAFHRVKLRWPRTLRALFSNPLLVHQETRVPGRGTEEMKTNDVTGRFKPGFVGVEVELGRPGAGTRFADVEKVARACAAHQVEFEPANPVTQLMQDRRQGILQPEILRERVMSAIIEFSLPADKLLPLLQDLRSVSADIDTIFSLGVCERLDAQGSAPTLSRLASNGMAPSENGKVNMGLGRSG